MLYCHDTLITCYMCILQSRIVIILTVPKIYMWHARMSTCVRCENIQSGFRSSCSLEEIPMRFIESLLESWVLKKAFWFSNIHRTWRGKVCKSNFREGRTSSIKNEVSAPNQIRDRKSNVCKFLIIYRFPFFSIKALYIASFWKSEGNHQWKFTHKTGIFGKYL